MNDDDRRAALERRGFTRRQAAFLTLVLLHSGCFLRRQHVAFCGVKDGACTTGFVRALERRRLATRHTFARHTQVVRLESRLLYDAIGEPDSRLRREAEPMAITHRLMTLDALIALRDMPCLATEAEKVDHFTRVCGVPEADLPGRVYRARTPGAPATIRHFVDHVPVLLGDHATVFVFVLGWAPLGVFATFLKAYAPLLRRLPRAAIRFCTPDDQTIHRAARLCERRFGRPSDGEVKAVLAHFEARHRYEERRFRTFTDADLARLRYDLSRFKGPRFEAWYDRWCEVGDAATPPVDPVAARVDGVEFAPHVLVHPYPFEGRIQTDRRRRVGRSRETEPEKKFGAASQPDSPHP